MTLTESLKAHKDGKLTLEALITEAHDLLLQTARNKLLDFPHARLEPEECLSLAYPKIVKLICTFGRLNSTSTFTNLVRHILVEVLIDQWRMNQRRPSTIAFSNYASVQKDLVPESKLVLLLKDLMDELRKTRPREASYLEMKLVHGKDDADIERDLHLTKNARANLARRARKSLIELTRGDR